MKKCMLFFLLFICVSLSATVQAKSGHNQAADPEITSLTPLIDYSESGFTKKVIFRGKEYMILLFAFKQGQQLTPHTIPIDAFVHVLEGTATVIIDGKEYTVQAGHKIVLPKDLPHGLTAYEDFKMLLVK
ncbi:MAG: cupin domain-containing protein [Desulfobulbaceae bacterium]|nr:cupin domain-containing protein [Desulfobulbaceae bacterium]